MEEQEHLVCASHLVKSAITIKSCKATISKGLSDYFYLNVRNINSVLQFLMDIGIERITYLNSAERKRKENVSGYHVVGIFLMKCFLETKMNWRDVTWHITDVI